MNKKTFSAFEKQVNRILEKYSKLYAINIHVFERKVAEHKANSCSWGGHEELQYLQEFNSSINENADEIFDAISLLLKKIGRKLSKKQSKTICNKCVAEINRYIDDFKVKYTEVMGHINNTQTTNFDLLKGNTNGRITEYFELLQFVSYNKMDKAYRIAIISTIIAGTSTLISLAGVILSIVLK